MRRKEGVGGRGMRYTLQSAQRQGQLLRLLAGGAMQYINWKRNTPPLRALQRDILKVCLQVILNHHVESACHEKTVRHRYIFIQ